MVKKFKITYTSGKGEHQEELLASSKYDAKMKFYHKFPLCGIIKVEEITDEQRKAD
jgi:hypothetical protein